MRKRRLSSAKEAADPDGVARWPLVECNRPGLIQSQRHSDRYYAAAAIAKTAACPANVS
jgi:hypothetical protein